MANLKQQCKLSTIINSLAVQISMMWLTVLV